MTAMSTSQEYESSITLISDTFTTPASTSYAADMSSSSSSERSVKNHPNVKTATFEVDGNGSDVSPLEDTDDNVTKLDASYYEEEKVNAPEQCTCSNEDKVIVSAEWTVSPANAVAGIEQELDTALADAAEAGRKKANMEEEMVTARAEAELQVKKLQERLEEKIQNALMLELELENAQDSMKEKEKEYTSETNQLRSKMEVELETIRNERTALNVKIAGLEEENAILCAKLLGGSAASKQKRSGAAAGLCRQLLSRLDDLKLYRERLWKRRNRGVQL